jgi:CheY-like chemotaxis protein
MQHAAILIVDDDADDREIVQECFEAGGISNVDFFESGSAILNYLNAITDHADLPRLIISDLNMPAITGIDLLKSIKRNPAFKFIDVVILSTTDKEDYMQECLRFGARACFTKPYTYSELTELRDQFSDMAALNA